MLPAVVIFFIQEGLTDCILLFYAGNLGLSQAGVRNPGPEDQISNGRIKQMKKVS